MTLNLIHNILNFLFPQKCLACGVKNEILCKNCLKIFPYTNVDESSNVFSATNYNYEPARKTIWLLKYRGARNLAEPLAELIYQRLPLKNLSSQTEWVIIPIPLSKKRFKGRGFNQSELIAQHLAQKLNIKIDTNILYKIKHTPSQVDIKNREERLKNIKNSFALKNNESIKNKNIIIIDDVTTTGATINEAKKILRHNGAKKIIATVVARG